MADPVARASARIERWFRAGLAAMEPAAAVRRHLAREGRTLLVGGERVPVPGRLLVVGAGKAALGMVRGAEEVCGDLIAGGLVITKDGHAEEPMPGRVRVLEAAHPVPDERGVSATRQILALVRDEPEPGDVVLALISGGGSALLEAPRPPVTIADLAATTNLLLRAGAPIQDFNTVRTPLSEVKGGGLRDAAAGATVVTLILSDVLGNDPRVIASGPTVPGRGGLRAPLGAPAALAVLDRYGLRERVPPSVVDTLETLRQRVDERVVTPGQAPNRDGWITDDDEVIGGHSLDVLRIVGDNTAAVQAVAAAAEGDGLYPCIVWQEREGEAAALGRAWVEACIDADGDADVLLGGGEATVTVRGAGIGGRNTEFALAAALALEERAAEGWVVASLATDGQDGPTGVAGAIADAGTAGRARATGVDPVAALERNDSLRVFEAAGGVVRTGPTGTNVNDVYLAVRR